MNNTGGLTEAEFNRISRFESVLPTRPRDDICNSVSDQLQALDIPNNQVNFSSLHLSIENDLELYIAHSIYRGISFLDFIVKLGASYPYLLDELNKDNSNIIDALACMYKKNSKICLKKWLDTLLRKATSLFYFLRNIGKTHKKSCKSQFVRFFCKFF